MSQNKLHLHLQFTAAVALFAQCQSLMVILLLLLHFSTFLLEILKLASQLKVNMAVILLIGFLNLAWRHFIAIFRKIALK